VSKLTASENHRGFIIVARAGRAGGKWALADVQPGDEDGNLGRANARLIAAAPELLEMLRYCREWLQGSSPKAAARIQAIDALIAKTTGDE